MHAKALTVKEDGSKIADNVDYEKDGAFTGLHGLVILVSKRLLSAFFPFKNYLSKTLLKEYRRLTK